jgi:hypothetical protein
MLARGQTNYCQKKKSGAARSRQLAPVFGGKVHIESSFYREQILCMYANAKKKWGGDEASATSCFWRKIT